MTDITMCLSTTCAARKSCYRYKAYPSDNQAYFVIAPGSGITCPQRIDDFSTTKPIRDWREVDSKLNPAVDAA